MTVDPVAVGIYNLLDGTDFDTALGNRLYREIAPQDSAYPYAIIYYQQEIKEWTFDRNIRSIQIQVSVFSQGSDGSSGEIDDLMTKLRTAIQYKTAAPTISGYHLVCVKETFNNYPEWNDGVWAANQSYELMISTSE